MNNQPKPDPDPGRPFPGKMQTIVDVVCQYYQISPATLRQPGRLKDVVWARHTAIFFCCELLDAGVQAVGKAFNRDRTNVGPSCLNVLDQCSVYPARRAEIDQLRDLILKRLSNLQGTHPDTSHEPTQRHPI